MEKKRKRGDRRDGRWVKEAPALQVIMMNLFPNRTDNEVYLNDKFDCTEMMKYLEQKNALHPEYKTTIFHAFVLSVARMVKERPKMNYFIQGRRMYERNEISLAFIVKKKFADNGGESLMTVYAKDDDTIDGLSKYIHDKVNERRTAKEDGGIDKYIDMFGKTPRWFLMLFIRIVRWLDFWGKVPKAFTDGDTNYASVLLSNLGSIHCPAVYHHLNNYGTNSVMITLGEVHKEEMIMPDGHKEIRDVVDIGATLDERIADGFYFSKSLRLIKYIMAHPELLDKPLGEPSGFDYNA